MNLHRAVPMPQEESAAAPMADEKLALPAGLAESIERVRMAEAAPGYRALLVAQAFAGWVETAAFEGGRDARRGVLRAAGRACGVPSDDVDAALVLARHAGPAILRGLRDGAYANARAAQAAWRSQGGALRSRGPSAPINAQGFVAGSKEARLGSKDIKWLKATAAEILASHGGQPTVGQRSLPMARALVARGLASDQQGGGAAMSSKGKKLVGAVLGVEPHEIGVAVTLLRKIRAGAIDPAAAESVLSGRYGSCGNFLKQNSAMRRRRSGAPLEVVMGREAMEAIARQVMARETIDLFVPSQRAVAFLERMLKARVLSTGTRLSKQIGAVRAVAVAQLGVAKCEFDRCWWVLRAVERKELPEAVLADIRSGACSAERAVKFRGPAAKDGGQDAGTGQPVTIASYVPAHVQAVDRGRTTDPVQALHEAMAAVGAELDRILDLARAEDDQETSDLVAEARRSVGLAKMGASKLLCRRRSARGAGRTTKKTEG